MAFVKSTSVVTDIAITIPGLTGGTNGRVVRINGPNTVQNASNTDGVTSLNAILLKQGDTYYAAGLVTGFSSLVAGSPYFLASDGSLTSTPPIPTTSVRALYLGFAINETDFVFRPGIPISGS
jgi:hypothetical protein